MANFNFNKVILGGRISSPLELKMTQSGISLCQFSIAVNRRSAKDAQQQADFISCNAWRERAELICKFFKKGSSICIVGQIQTRSWTDQQGVKRYATEVLVDEVVFVDSKSDSQAAQPTHASNGIESPATNQNAAPAPAYAPQQQPQTAPTYYAPPMEPAPQFATINDDDLPF